jgi:hypothetical protein
MKPQIKFIKSKDIFINNKKRCIYTKPNDTKEYVKNNKKFILLSRYIKLNSKNLKKSKKNIKLGGLRISKTHSPPSPPKSLTPPIKEYVEVGEDESDDESDDNKTVKKTTVITARTSRSARVPSSSPSSPSSPNVKKLTNSYTNMLDNIDKWGKEGTGLRVDAASRGHLFAPVEAGIAGGKKNQKKVK